MAPAEREVNVGVLLVLAPSAELEPMRRLALRAAEDVRAELEGATHLSWIFHEETPARLPDDAPRRPSDFLDEATLSMVEGPYDVVLVLTDVGLVSRKQRVVAGLASPVARVAVVSTRKLLMTPRGAPSRALDAEPVRWNASALVLHLLGHLLGLDHARSAEGAMAPFRFGEQRRSLPRFGPGERSRLERRAARFPEREHRGRSALGVLAFHVSSALRHPGELLWPLFRNRSLFLPLALPGLATAAVAPTFLLVFTAEIWDVGLNLPVRAAWLFAAASVVAATVYLVQVQNLFFPHKEKRLVTEHMAVVNLAILLTMLVAMVGLFLMVGLLMLGVEVFLFPPRLIETWPTLDDPTVDIADKIRLAGFISTIGVLTGALAGGLESRTVIRHLALFADEP